MKKMFVSEKCLVCLKREPSIVVYPCGHLVVCNKCYKKLEKNKCLCCRKEIVNYKSFIEKKTHKKLDYFTFSMFYDVILIISLILLILFYDAQQNYYYYIFYSITIAFFVGFNLISLVLNNHSSYKFLYCCTLITSTILLLISISYINSILINYFYKRKRFCRRNMIFSTFFIPMSYLYLVFLLFPLYFKKKKKLKKN